MRRDMLEVTRLMSALVAAATIAACGGDEDSVTRPTPAISIALSSSALSVTQGTTGSASVNVTRSGGFSGDVAITVEGLPGTVTYASAPATISGNASSAVITFDVAGSATPGGINATVKATGTGVNAATSGLAITVVAAPTYTVAVANATVTATQGGIATQTVNITRTGGFAEGVALTATGLPTGVTAAFDPPTVSGNSSTLTLTAAANAAPGNATVMVNGTANGQADKTATFELTVNAAPTYTLAMSPATLTIQQGTSGTSTVKITQSGPIVFFVRLTAVGVPNGVTAVFAPNSATKSSTLTLTASATAATGTRTVTIQGFIRTLVLTTTLALTVNPAAGGSSNTSLELFGVDQTPVWFALTDVPDGARALTNDFTATGSGAAGATVGTSGGLSKGEYRYYGVAASKQIARDPSDSRPCNGRLSDADPRPFDRRSRHRHSSVSGRVLTTRPFRDDVGR